MTVKYPKWRFYQKQQYWRSKRVKPERREIKITVGLVFYLVLILYYVSIIIYYLLTNT